MPPLDEEHVTPDLDGEQAPAEQPAAPGDRYRTGRRLGLGGMGEIVEAYDDQIGRDVAIKRMRAASPSDGAVKRFLREARIQGRLEHPSIVPVYELGRDSDGRPYFAMKRLQGTTLAKILEGAAPPRQRLLRAFADVCLAMELAHQRGVIHRDLKPENVMLGDFGETYVIDWGVAAMIGDAELDTRAAGTPVGTRGYMSPEQARGDRDLDARTDIYSLGCVLFEILAGERLHAWGVLPGADARPSRRSPDREIPPELDELCVRATAGERADRLATARELGERVQRYLDGDRDLEQRRAVARSCFDAATAAYHAGDRPTAIREAGRALALDPALRGPAELVTRLMLDPPQVMPAEVATAMAAESDTVVRRMARYGLIASFGYCAFFPLVPFASRSSLPWLAVMFLVVGLNTYHLYRFSRGHGELTPLRTLLLAAVGVAILAHLSSPFVLGPGLAAITAVGVMSGPFHERGQAPLVGAALALAVLVPWLLELAGVFPPSLEIGEGTMTVTSDLIGGPVVTQILYALFTVVLVAAAIVMTRGRRHVEHAARRQLHLQRWQLRQLVPT